MMGLGLLARMPGLSGILTGGAGWLEGDARTAAGVRAVLELIRGAELIGPPDPPALFRPLFDLEGEAAGLPPELLAAVAGIRTGFDPGAPGGLMGLPADDAAELRAAREALYARDLEAADRVRRNVAIAAAELAKLRTLPGGLAGALLLYVEAAEPERSQLEARAEVAAIVGAFALYLARRVPEERAALAAELLGVGRG